MDLINTTRNDELEKRAKRKRERELSDIRFIVKSPEGRRFYWKLMEVGGVFLNPYGKDTNHTFYNLGRQSISRDFLNDLLEAKPEALDQMRQEKKSEEKAEELEDQKLGDSV